MEKICLTLIFVLFRYVGVVYDPLGSYILYFFDFTNNIAWSTKIHSRHNFYIVNVTVYQIEEIKYIHVYNLQYFGFVGVVYDPLGQYGGGWVSLLLRSNKKIIISNQKC